ncbi:hypothetical protein [Methylobacterium gnaphalii]|uniref:Bacteriophage tail tape measure N-terminal domain-containing protein n=1 Tax=Methylobacterium gnaphalii TaxID=1010610 RepID=A0A512JRL5_9HYPH|nr:hypothetical protein [Methylobacterium gnaphalii]GEP12523.1 hypothetical protein MGN01_43680 [Methylobacterium gnaphalii]GJD70498.1 hypothetical protein MMMDOFMJ_3447 [Methylobacterium gnaphalii]GLS51484.1 hypothetical protein GCM10007885_43410 [Methylobacterium gnaphalii]
MPVRNVAIRLGVEGDAEVKRRIEETGRAGEQALQKIVPAAEAAGAAVDRQTARWERMAKAARDAEAAGRAQSNVNALFGIGQDTGGSARDSATVFEMQARAAEEAQRQSAALAREMASLRAQFVPLADAAQRYQQALSDIDRAQAAGAISGSQALDARLRETRAYEDATSKIERMGAASKAAAQASVNRQTIVPDRGADVAAYGEELDRLRAKYSPLFAAQQSYLAQLGEIRQAAKVGALAQDEAASRARRVRASAGGGSVQEWGPRPHHEPIRHRFHVHGRRCRHRDALRSRVLSAHHAHGRE